MKKLLVLALLPAVLICVGCKTDDNNRETPEDNRLGADNVPTLGAQIDRGGRAAISTALQTPFEANDEVKGAAKDEWNAAAKSDWPSFKDNIAASLAVLDSLDTTDEASGCGSQLLANEDDPDGRYNALANVLADDQLYVNLESGECGTYLGVEAEVVGAIPAGAGGCGGRTPLDDVIDRSYSVLAAGILTGVDDTITSDGRDHSISEFPWLAPANVAE